MSRSHKYTSIFPIASSNGLKQYKRYVNHRNRTKLRQLLALAKRSLNFDIYDMLKYPLIEFNEWDCPRDGKNYITEKDFHLINLIRLHYGKRAKNRKYFMSK